MAVFQPGLVWLASYPKSGNTWMRVLLANLIAGKEQPADINDLSEHSTLIGRWRFADDMLVDPDLLGWRELETMRPLLCDWVAQNLTTPFFCKTHDSFLGRNKTSVLGVAAKSALYMVRDPRDVAVSLCHHASLSLDRTIEQMLDAAFVSGGGMQLSYLLSDWAGHVSGWTSQRQVRTKVVRYEDMRLDTPGALTDIIEFLGAQATPAEIRRAVDHSSLDELQRQESSKGFRESRPGQKRFFRTGKIGEWREVLTPTQVRAIEDRCGGVMAAWGYTLEG